jgi:hypothetical protein
MVSPYLEFTTIYSSCIFFLFLTFQLRAVALRGFRLKKHRIVVNSKYRDTMSQYRGTKVAEESLVVQINTQCKIRVAAKTRKSENRLSTTCQFSCLGVVCLLCESIWAFRSFCWRSVYLGSHYNDIMQRRFRQKVFEETIHLIIKGKIQDIKILLVLYCHEHFPEIVVQIFCIAYF